MFTWVLALVLIGSVTGVYSEFRWRKLFASVIANAKTTSAEIDRLRGIIWTHEDTMRYQKERIASRENEVANLKAERDKTAKRILSLEDSWRAKCGELDAKTQELQQVKKVINQSWRLFLPDELTITTPTFQPKRPEEQPQKPTCDN